MLALKSEQQQHPVRVHARYSPDGELSSPANGRRLIKFINGTSEIRPPKTVQNRAIKETKPLGMALVLSKVNMRSVDPILPLKIQNSSAFNGFLAVVGCFRALLSRTTSGVLSCAPRTRRHAGCGCYR